MEPKEVALLALDAATTRGAAYAEVRIVRSEGQDLGVRNGELATLESPVSSGFSVRVLRGGAWGFSASPRFTRLAVVGAAGRAAAAADALARLRREHPIELAPNPPQVARWEGPCRRDPFAVPLEEKVELLRRCDAGLRTRPEVVATSCTMSFLRQHAWFANTEGAFLEQRFVRSGGGILARAAGRGDVQTRSYPMSFGGQFVEGGYEAVEALELPAHVERTRDEAVALLEAPPCPGGVRDLLLGSSQMALQVHESCGHPCELDRVLGAELDLAGGSFLTPEKLGQFRYGSELVTIVADALSPGGLGTFGFDDEGVPAGRWPLIEKGVLRGYLTNRETARAIGEEASRGAARAEGWRSFPIIRMVNVSLEPGTWDLDALVADTEDGVLCDTVKTWSIDQMRLNFQFTTEVGWEIKNGRIVRLLKNPTYQGTTPEFWASCDAIGSEKHFVLWGVAQCGKGNPMQLAEVSHGAAPARFRGVRFVGP
ncbi:MAG TPA: TldD/PmbA family protein [Planctomycetota bacterium]|jgi:TldD protein|nr:TldD/PmbA family protein [Planctomycetota bacterium]